MKKLLSVSMMCLLFLGLQAQTVDEILDQYFENIGGVEAWQKLNSMKIIGTTSMQGMEFPITVYSKRPNLEMVEVSVQGMQIVQAFDGKTAWSINPMMGSSDPTKAAEEEATEAAKRQFEDNFINYKEKGHTVELLGTKEIEGTETFEIKLTKNTGDEEIHYFDSENYVPIMMRSFAAAGPMKGQTVETYLSDYEEHEGLMVPMSMEQKVGGQTLMQGTWTEVEFDAEMGDDIFAFPSGEQDSDNELKMMEGSEKAAKKGKEKMKEKSGSKEQFKGSNSNTN